MKVASRSIALLEQKQQSEYIHSLFEEEQSIASWHSFVNWNYVRKELMDKPIDTFSFDLAHLFHRPIHFNRGCSLMAGAIKVKNFRENALMGVHHWGSIIAHEVACQIRIPYISLKDVKDCSFEPPTKDLLLVDDSSSSGTSIRTCVLEVRRAGWKVEKAVTLYDKEMGAAKRLGEIGVTLYSLTTFSELVKEARKRGYPVEKLESQRETLAVKAALENPEYRWSSPEAIAEEVDLPIEKVNSILNQSNKNAWGTNLLVTKGKGGRKYYTTEKHYDETIKTKHRILGAFSGKLA